MDGHFAKYSKSDKDIPYDLSYIWSLNKHTHKTSLQIQRLMVARGGEQEVGGMGEGGQKVKNEKKKKKKNLQGGGLIFTPKYAHRYVTQM